jgi:hypothetical protein
MADLGLDRHDWDISPVEPALSVLSEASIFAQVAAECCKADAGKGNGPSGRRMSDCVRILSSVFAASHHGSIIPNQYVLVSFSGASSR